MKTELCEIAYKYGTDKCPEIRHPYTPFYYELLKDKRQTVKKVLEIGIGYQEVMPEAPTYRTGASLFMWRDFFPNATIHGIDINPKTMFVSSRIQTFVCDQTKADSLRTLIMVIGSDIDLVIDDGCHGHAEQVFTCQTLMPLLKKDVIYVIEDVNRPEYLVNGLSGYETYIPRMKRRYHEDRLLVVKNK